MKKDDLQKVTPSATEDKDHFVIIDAVGVTKSNKSDTRALERVPSVSLQELMMKAARGTRDENILTSLASRIIRLNIRMTEAERKEFQEKAGVSLSKAAQALLDAFDPDVIVERAGIALSVDKNELSPEQKA